MLPQGEDCRPLRQMGPDPVQGVVRSALRDSSFQRPSCFYTYEMLALPPSYPAGGKNFAFHRILSPRDLHRPGEHYHYHPECQQTPGYTHEWL